MKKYGTREVWISDDDTILGPEDTAGQIVEPNLCLPMSVADFVQLCDRRVKGARFGVGTTSTGKIMAGVYPDGMSLEHAVKTGMAVAWVWTEEALKEAIKCLTDISDDGVCDPEV